MKITVKEYAINRMVIYDDKQWYPEENEKVIHHCKQVHAFTRHGKNIFVHYTDNPNHGELIYWNDILYINEPEPHYDSKEKPNSLEMTPDEVMSYRGHDYGDTWILTSELFEFLLNKVPHPTEKLLGLAAPGLFHNWFMILEKLIRAIYSPTKKDHWIDIRNYAELVILHLQDSSYRGEK